MSDSKTLSEQVESALDTIRPYLEADGGNVELVEISKDNIAVLKLLGACGSCPMSVMTLKAGVEQSIIKAVPEISGIDCINITDANDPNAVLPEALRK